jgi:large subunit ribosomal protein L25
VDVKINATVRQTGKQSILTDLRTEGKVPGTFYGKKIDPVTIFVDEDELREAMNTEAGSNVMVDLVIDDSALKGKQTAMIKDLQKNPITGVIKHVDFVKVSMSEEIHATIPVTVVGESAGVKLGGVMQHSIRELNVKCLPGNMPEHYEIDVTEMNVGDSVHVKDLAVIEGVEVLNDPEEILVSIVPPAKEEEVEVTEEAEGVTEPEVIGEKKDEEEAGE